MLGAVIVPTPICVAARLSHRGLHVDRRAVADDATLILTVDFAFGAAP